MPAASSSRASFLSKSSASRPNTTLAHSVPSTAKSTLHEKPVTRGNRSATAWEASGPSASTTAASSSAVGAAAAPAAAALTFAARSASTKASRYWPNAAGVPPSNRRGSTRRSPRRSRSRSVIRAARSRGDPPPACAAKSPGAQANAKLCTHSQCVHSVPQNVNGDQNACSEPYGNNTKPAASASTARPSAVLSHQPQSRRRHEYRSVANGASHARRNRDDARSPPRVATTTPVLNGSRATKVGSASTASVSSASASAGCGVAIEVATTSSSTQTIVW
mmetsp:Transcript_25100/g.70513  ORF Transcript_25100/g.70513 Transcript_25100/m.70513 type:complete len:278 (+) Transcript_25100:387-1220(+)